MPSLNEDVLRFALKIILITHEAVVFKTKMHLSMENMKLMYVGNIQTYIYKYNNYFVASLISD